MSLIADARNIAHKYLGRESETFINRQCRGHLKMEPDHLGPRDIPQLAKWVGISAGIILPPDRAQAFRQEILNLVP